MHVQILTLFPEAFPGTLGIGVIGSALQSGIWSLDTINIRDYASDKCRHVDDTPYGGGAGMVLRADVVAAAMNAAYAKSGANARKLVLSPRGKPLRQSLIADLALSKEIIILCGRYEGIDQRVIDREGLVEVSLGDFILAGGEVAAMALIESCVRLLPDVLGNKQTLCEESFANGLLEYPHYTRPAVWEGAAIPPVLLSGNHADIEKWRREQSVALTKERRPDLWNEYSQSACKT